MGDDALFDVFDQEPTPVVDLSKNALIVEQTTSTTTTTTTIM
jgi:hypothetical protein